MTTIFDLSAERRDALLHRLLSPHETKKRRTHVRDRYCVLRDDFDYLLRRWVHEVYEEPETKADVLKFAIKGFNPLRRVVNRLAVAYKIKPTRTIGKAKGPNAALAKFVKDIQWNRKAHKANRYATGLNTVAVLPTPMRTDDELTVGHRFITGAHAEMEFDDGASIASRPAVLAWLTGKNAHEPDVPVIEAADSEFWTWWDGRGTLLRTVRHGFGTFPGDVLHNTLPDEEQEDPWDAMFNSGVLDCCKHVAIAAASMGWTRKTQCRKLVEIATQGDQFAAGGQPAAEKSLIHDPEGAWELKGQGVKLAVHDLDQAVVNFLAHIRALTDETFEVMTGAVSTLADPDPSSPLEGQAAVRQHAAIREHRADQVEWLEPFERRMLWLSARMARRIGLDAPEPDRLKDKLEVEFGELPFLESPMERLEYHREATRFGISNQVNARIEQTGETRQQAHEAIMEMAKERNELHEFLADRNQPAEDAGPRAEREPAAPGEAPEARTGRFGGRASPAQQGA